MKLSPSESEEVLLTYYWEVLLKVARRDYCLSVYATHGCKECIKFKAWAEEFFKEVM